MQKFLPQHCLLLAVLTSSLVVAGCGGDDGDGGGAQNPTVQSRTWLAESDFDDPSLHARPGQVVILDLESDTQLVQQQIRYWFDDVDDVRYCIPEDDPYVTELMIIETSTGNASFEEPGGDCLELTVSPGRYELHITHDGSRVPDGGGIAFLHHPQQRAADLELGFDASAQQTAFVLPNFMAFRYAGKFVTGATTSPLLALEPIATSVDEHSVFRFTSVGGGKYTIADGTGATVKTQSSNCPQVAPIFVGSSSTSSTTAQFDFEDFGNDRFGMCLTQPCNNHQACIFVDSTTNVLEYNDNGNTGSLFTVDYRGYDCPTTCDSSTLVLEEGEVALFSQENYAGKAIVFKQDVADFSVYNGATSNGLSIGDNHVRSVRVGPNTMAVLYANGNYQGNTVMVLEDASTLSGSTVGNDAVSSMHINVLESGVSGYVLQSMGCENCLLAGADLSNTDLTGSNFSGARLSGANLSGSFFHEANFDRASLVGSDTRLSGADFSFASLRCTDFSQADLSGATFGPLLSLLWVVDEAATALIQTDPVTGLAFEFSGPNVGSGTAFVDPVSVALNASGDPIVADAGLPGVFRIDNTDGTRTVVSSDSVGSGPQLLAPSDVAIDSSGNFLVTDALAMIFRINPTTGARTVVSGGSTGSGTAFSEPSAIAVASDGHLVVVDRGAKAIFSVNASNGARTVVSSGSVGTGPSFVAPVDITIDSDGTYYVADLTLPGVFEVNSSTGNRRLVSGPNAGSGPTFFNVSGVAAAGDGTLLVTDEVIGVLRVNIASGNRTIVSDSSTGGSYESARAVTFTPSLTLDLSCRLNATKATIEASTDNQTFPIGYWRYIELTEANVLDANGAVLSTVEEPVNMSGAHLDAINGLTGALLDGVILDCATPSQSEKNCSQLVNTILNQVSMKEASAVNAALNGARLIDANLEGANLSGAQFLKSTDTTTSAILDGAYLKNANLSQAQLSGVSMINANWYSSSQVLCEGASWNGRCASGTGANLSNADLSGAYLAGVDFGSATLQQVNFRGAILPGANFTQSNLSGDPNTGQLTHFNGAFLQGANFTNADLTGATFEDAYIDLQSFSGLEMIFQLPAVNLMFTGYTPPANPPECVLFTTNQPTTTPTATTGYTCPDGSNSPCSNDVWQCATCVPNSSSTPPASVDGSFPGSCTHIDFNW